MAKRRRRKRTPKCRECGIMFAAEDDRRGDLCMACHATVAAKRRERTGQRLLDKAKETTVERDGRIFVVKTLPPKRRSR